MVQCGVVCCSVSELAIARTESVRLSVLQCVAASCIVLQCVHRVGATVDAQSLQRPQVGAAVCCSVLQCVAVCCSVSNLAIACIESARLSVLKPSTTASRCSIVLQYVAV